MRFFSCLILVILVVASAHADTEIPKWQSLLDEAARLEKSRDYPKALEVAEAALKEAQTEHGDVHKSVAMVMHRIATIHWYLGLPDTEELFLRTLDAWNALPDPEPIEMAKTLSNLGGYYRSQLRQYAAERYLLEALALKRDHLPPKDRSTAITLQLLTSLYRDMGDYARAEEYQQAALDLRCDPETADANLCAGSLIETGLLYAHLKRLEDAEKFLEEARRFSEEKGLVTMWLSATTNLSWLSLAVDVERTKSLCNQALSVLDTIPNPVPDHRIALLLNLGAAYRAGGHAAEALVYHVRCDSLARMRYGDDVYGPYRLSSLQQMAADQMKLKNFESADSLYQLLLRQRDSQFGELHFESGYALEGLVELCLHTGQHERGAVYAQRMFLIWDRDLANAMLVLGEMDALSKASRRATAAGCFYSFYFRDPGPRSELVRSAADMALASKGRISDEVFSREANKKLLQDPTVESLAGSLKETKLALSDLYVRGPRDMPPAKYKARVDSLHRAAEELETSLARRSARLAGRVSAAQVDAPAVAACLPAKSALVEYLKTTMYEASGDTLRENPHYVAVLLERDTPPRVYDLGPAGKIDSLVAAYREHLLKVSELGHPPLEAHAREYAGIARRLYTAALGPLEARIRKSDMILFAPDGTLNLVSFAGLSDDRGKYVIEEHAVAYLSAGRDLLRLKHEMPDGKGAVAIGDPDFDASVELRRTQSEGITVASAVAGGSSLRSVRSACPNIWSEVVSALPGTREEVDRVAAAWQGIPISPARRFVGAGATEDNFKRFAPRSRMVHIATHGFFREKGCERAIGGDEGGLDENPLLRSGFFLAGANLHGAGADSAGCEDGIVTASEVSEMDFAGTRIVVLSACETALGDVQEAEGTYGLRRAFQMAGARSVVSALWPVSDETSATMMGEIYSRSRAPLIERIREIELDQIGELRKNGLSDHPQNWAAYIVTGDWK